MLAFWQWVRNSTPVIAYVKHRMPEIIFIEVLLFLNLQKLLQSCHQQPFLLLNLHFQPPVTNCPSTNLQQMWVCSWNLTTDFGNYNGMMNGDTSLLQVLFFRQTETYFVAICSHSLCNIHNNTQGCTFFHRYWVMETNCPSLIMGMMYIPELNKLPFHKAKWFERLRRV